MALFGRATADDDQRAARYARWLNQRHPLAIASLVLGIFSLIEFGALLIFGIAGIVLGLIALRQLRSVTGACAPAAGRASPPATAAEVATPLAYADAGLPPPIRADRYEPAARQIVATEGRWLALAGIALSALSLAIAAVLYLLPAHIAGAAGAAAGGAP